MPNVPGAQGPTEADGSDQNLDGRWTPFAEVCALCVGVFLLLLASACLLRLSLLRPSGILPIEAYSYVLSFHGHLALPFTNACQVALLTAIVPFDVIRRSSRRMVSGVVWLFVCQALVLALSSFLDTAGYAAHWGLLIPSLPLAGLFAWRALQWRRIGYAASVVLAASAIDTPLRLFSEELAFLLCAVALRSSPTRASEPQLALEPEIISTDLVVVVSAVLVLLDLIPQSLVPLGVLRLCATMWLTMRLWRSTPALFVGPFARLMARSGLALMASNLLLRLTLQGRFDPHILDTLYIVAAFHAALLALVFLLLAVALREFRHQPAQEWTNRWLSRGGIASLLGGLSVVLSMAQLGMRGMPKNYGAYLPMMTPWQLLVSCSAFLFCIGALVTGAALVRERRAAKR